VCDWGVTGEWEGLVRTGLCVGPPRPWWTMRLASSLAAVRDGVGAFSIFGSVCRCASLSPRTAANEHQVAALQSYVACFRDGTLVSHVQGSRHWVQDKGPTVESYIGFIESYQLRRVYWSRRLYVKLVRSLFCHASRMQ
jgi:hypothetical protein